MWIVEEGEQCEGSHILAICETLQDALACAENMLKAEGAFGTADEETAENPDGSIRYRAWEFGCSQITVCEYPENYRSELYTMRLKWIA